MQQEDYTTAATVFSKAIETDPSCAYAYCGRGVAHLARGNLRMDGRRRTGKKRHGQGKGTGAAAGNWG
ncbi:MAG: tetratricopeptide repeat protein [Rhodopirellula sp.]|nr:tetratricopeptide repeat protein [Rhodopirellula sp.]